MSNIFPSINNTSLFVNTLTTPKIVFLPAASTIRGHIFYIKDICGNAAKSSIFISTQGRDTLESYNYSTIHYGLMSTNYGSVTLASDGILNWMVLQHYISNAI